MIKFGALLPHPPLIVAGIGQNEDLAQVAETTAAFQRVNEILAEDPPETLVVFTPHGTVFQDALVVYGQPVLAGDLGKFGLSRIWEWENDLELARGIVEAGVEANLPVFLMDPAMAAQYRLSGELDHGVLVPLSMFDSSWAEKVKLIVIPLSLLPLEELYHFGAIIRQAAAGLNRRVAVIASGDLSHCLLPGAPSGYDPRGAEFDRKLLELINSHEVRELFHLDPVLLEKAAECGFRSLIMLLGTLDESRFEATVHSYQGPFGVGYAVVTFQVAGECPSLTGELFDERKQEIRERRAKEGPLVKYARGVVEAHILGQALPSAGDLDSFLNERAGVFVSIKKHGQLRGCIGTTRPTRPNLVLEVRENAISASTRDPRFEPVTGEELEELVYSVDVLLPAGPISGLGDLDPKRYGVIVSKGFRKGLLLPNLEGIETAEEQVAIAKRKAGIAAGESVDLERFEVIRYY
jgi:MEMO1 family protein